MIILPKYGELSVKSLALVTMLNPIPIARLGKMPLEVLMAWSESFVKALSVIDS